MLRVIAVIFSVAIFWQVNYQSMLWSWYVLNTNHIATNFCVNKQNSHCKGKCHINAIIDTIEDQSENPMPATESYLLDSQLTQFIFHLDNQGTIKGHTEIQRPYMSYLEKALKPHLEDVFRPPQSTLS